VNILFSSSFAVNLNDENIYLPEDMIIINNAIKWNDNFSDNEKEIYYQSIRDEFLRISINENKNKFLSQFNSYEEYEQYLVWANEYEQNNPYGRYVVTINNNIYICDDGHGYDDHYCEIDEIINIYLNNILRQLNENHIQYIHSNCQHVYYFAYSVYSNNPGFIPQNECYNRSWYHFYMCYYCNDPVIYFILSESRQHSDPYYFMKPNGLLGTKCGYCGYETS